MASFEAATRTAKDRVEFVHECLKMGLSDDLRAKRVLSLANGALGVMSAAALAVCLIGQAMALAQATSPKSRIKQVDRLLSNIGGVPWDLFAAWAPEVVGERRDIVVAMDWTDIVRQQAAVRPMGSDAIRHRPCSILCSSFPSTRAYAKNVVTLYCLAA